MFDISFDGLALLAHVMAASILIACSFVAPFVRRSMLAADSLGALRQWLDLDARLSGTAPPAAMAVLATGVYLGSVGWWTQPWFYVAVAAWAVNSALAATVLRKSAARLAHAVGPREGAVDPAVDAIRRARAWDLAHEVMRGSDFAMLYLMFQKPGLPESLLVTGAAIGASVALGWRQTKVRAQARTAVVQG